MLHTSNGFGKIISSPHGPGSFRGVAVTPGNNTYGSDEEVIAGASVTDDVFAIQIGINGGAVAANAKDTLVTISTDPAGGTSYTALINHLAAPGSGQYMATGGITYWFPLRIKAGSSIAAKASVNNATVGLVRVWCKLWCKPSRPELMRVGTFVRTFGDTAATSTGTAVTVTAFDGSNEGAWTQLGSALAEPLFFWQAGFSLNSGTVGNNIIHMDLGLGDASNKDEVIQNQPVHLDGNNEHVIAQYPGGYFDAATGALVYGRLLGDGGPVSGSAMIAYGVGG